MPHTRMPYWAVPINVRNTIEEQIGAVTTATSIGTGLNSSVAALASTPQGRFFIKGLPADHSWAWTQKREADIARFVRPVAPDFVARVVDDGWDILIFEALPGEAANYAPASADLAPVSHLLTALGDIPCPPIELREAPQRFQAYAESSELHYFAGQAFLHTDLNNANVIVTDARARFVDWGWATRGAPWLDAAYWTIWLIAAGHELTDAEDIAATVPSWRHATANGIDAFAGANARLWTEIAGTEPDHFASPIAAAARRWHRYRSKSGH